MNQIEVFVPTAEARTQKWPLAPRLDRLAGARIGWLDNMKANAGDLLGSVAAVLHENGVDFEMVTGSKNATAAAPQSVMSHLKTCDAVVLAIAD